MAAASGASVINLQREVNGLGAFSGRAAGSTFDSLPTWTNTDVGTASDTLKDRSDTITATFNETTGHNHDGTAGNGAPIDVTDLTNIKSGVEAIGSGVTSIGVTFSSNFAAATYGLGISIVNTTDADPIQLVGVVTNKTVSGFVVNFFGQAETDTANYELAWVAIAAVDP